MGFVRHFPFRLVPLALLLAWTVAGCGDLSPESEGTATMRLRLASNTHSPALLRQASRIADNTSNRATVELIPVASCSGSPGNTGSLGAVAVTLGGTPTATFNAVPLGTALKLCVYLYKASTTSTTPDATGETDTFTISTENYASTIIVTVYEILYAKLRLQITDKYGNGPYKGVASYYDNTTSQRGTVQSSGFPDNATTYAFPSDNNTSSYFSSDNKTYHLVVDNVSYDPRGTSLTTTIALPGFKTLQETFVISETNVVSGERTYAVQLTPEMINSSWLSIDNLTVANDNGTRRTAEISGYLRLNVPASKADNVSQLIATLTVKRVGGTETTITPSVNLSLVDNVSSDSDNTSYCYKFCLGTDTCMSGDDTDRCYGFVHQTSTSNQLGLVHGSNSFQVISTVDGTSTTLDNATASYDSCLDNSTMCLNLNWESAGDLDLHTYYYPSWNYTDNASAAGFSPGTQYHISFCPPGEKNLTGTADLYKQVHIGDSTTAGTPETQVWATDSGKVEGGTYLVYFEEFGKDGGSPTARNVTLTLSGPGLSDNLTYGPYNLKAGFTPLASDPQPVLVIQVDNNTIMSYATINPQNSLSNTTFMDNMTSLSNSTFMDNISGTQQFASGFSATTHFGSLARSSLTCPSS